MSDNNKYTLHYFNARGRAELIRYILTYANVPFEDHRMNPEEWGKFKSLTPLGQIPVLEWKNDGGKSVFLCQSCAIIRYLSSLHGLAGKTPEERARADEAFEAFKDFVEFCSKVMFEQDGAKQEHLQGTLVNEVVPRIFGFLERRLKENGGSNLAGGDEYTYADLFVAQGLNSLAVGVYRLVDMTDIAAFYPTVTALADTINKLPNISKYLVKRPTTDL